MRHFNFGQNVVYLRSCLLIYAVAQSLEHSVHKPISAHFLASVWPRGLITRLLRRFAIAFWTPKIVWRYQLHSTLFAGFHFRFLVALPSPVAELGRYRNPSQNFVSATSFISFSTSSQTFTANNSGLTGRKASSDQIIQRSHATRYSCARICHSCGMLL